MDRISTSMTYHQPLSSLQQTTAALFRVREQVTSGKSFARPSEAPAQQSQILTLRESQRQIQNFRSGIESGKIALDAQEGVLRQVLQGVDEARSTIIEGAGVTLSQTDRDHLADRLDLLLEQMAQLSQTRKEDRYLFGGTETQREPFTFTRESGKIVQAQYMGNEQQREILIGPEQTLPIHLPGKALFSPVFDTLIEVRDLLRNKGGLSEGDQVAALSQRLDTVQRTHENTLTHLTTVGNRLAYLEQKDSSAQDMELQLNTWLSQIEDVNLPQAISEMWAQESAYQSALQVLKRIPAEGFLNSQQ